MKKYFLLVCLFAISTHLVAQSNREVLSFDKGWKFHLGDIPFPIINGHEISYSNAKAGKAWGAAAPEYNDYAWQTVTLPHDWAVESPYDSIENVAQGYRKRGFGWYRKHFKLSSTDKGKHLEIQLDGIATNCTVWFNGNIVHHNWCGYTSMYIDISSMAKYGDEVNTIAIRVDANTQEGWWYEGAGIYRHTWLVKRAPIHITTDGVYANPIKLRQQEWLLPVEVDIMNIGKLAQAVQVVTTLVDADRKIVASASTTVQVPLFTATKAKIDIPVSNPILWTLEKPTLYKVITELRSNDLVQDLVSTNCGFRTLRFTTDSGFYLNDQHVKLQGVCNHQDHAGVGTAIPDALWMFRLRKLKEMGVNAYRCSHNPPPNILLNLCDSMGILVMDENRNFNVSPDYAGQLAWMVKRDRNHPSIILWSVFNEEPMQGSYQGYEMVRRMSALVKSLDTTRPVTAAMNGGLFSKENVSQAVDVVGFNYQIDNYDKFHQAFPQLKLTSSEDGSAYQVRGAYVSDPANNVLNAYDTEAAPWGATHRRGWKAIATRPYLAGGFYWTGFDYRGEPTPFSWPSASSFFGIMDLCGFPKMAYYLHQAIWIKDKPVLQVVPHWSWPKDSIGKPIRVMTLTNADSVKLLLNGKQVGTAKVDPYDMNSFQVPYKPGKLEAIAYTKGKEVIRYKVETTSAAKVLQLIPDKPNLFANGTDAMPITVLVVDDKGRAIPTAHQMVHFTIKGNGSIIGLGNGNPNAHEPEKGFDRSLFNGLAQVIVQAGEGKEANIELTASAEGLASATIVIPVLPASIAPFVAAVQPPIYLSSWRMSPTSNNKPNAQITIADNDMNTWQTVNYGETQSFNNMTYALFQHNFTVNDMPANAKGKLSLRRLVGKAEVWVNNVLVHTKSTYAQADVQTTIELHNGNNKVVVLIEAEPHKKAGLNGTVVITPIIE